MRNKLQLIVMQGKIQIGKEPFPLLKPLQMCTYISVFLYMIKKKKLFLNESKERH